MPISYNYLAKATGLDRRHVSRVLKGECGVTLRSASQIAQAAGVTLDALWDHITGRVRIRWTRLKPPRRRPRLLARRVARPAARRRH